MAKRILIAEGNTADLALSSKRATGATAAWSYAAALRSLAPALEIEVVEPYFSDYAPEAIDFGRFDGFVVTGSGVQWSGADEAARPFWDLYERAFAAGTPAFGSCWGMQTAAVALGGETKAGPNGVEAGFARALRPSGEHQMTSGRRDGFDAVCMHRDDVTRAPDGAVVTVSNDHTAIQAFAYDANGASFWGVQYHPECDLNHIAHWLSVRKGPWEGDDAPSPREVKLIAEDPAFYARLAAKHKIGLDILDRRYHMTELANWLQVRVGADVPG